MHNTLKYILNKYNLKPHDNRSKSLVIDGTRDETLTALFAELGFKRGVEIGVEKGVFSETLCKNIPNLCLFGVDPWLAYGGYREHVDQEKLERFYEITLERMKPYDFRAFRAYSHEAHKYFADGSLDFVYIDGNHRFMDVARDITLWTPKVRKGGIIAGHDYRRNSKKWVNDTKDVIPAYAYALRINPWFILNEKVAACSWFWVNE